jgi:hypothetical protein
MSDFVDARGNKLNVGDLVAYGSRQFSDSCKLKFARVVALRERIERDVSRWDWKKKEYVIKDETRRWLRVASVNPSKRWNNKTNRYELVESPECTLHNFKSNCVIVKG